MRIIDTYNNDFSVFDDSPRTRARFLEANKRAKQFLKKRRGYKTPDFGRMILDLRNLSWSHEQIASVLDVSNSTTVSAWATGSKPFYEHGEAFIDLWRDQTGIERVPRIGEWGVYHYTFGQLDIFADGGEIDGFIEQLDREIGK